MPGGARFAVKTPPAALGPPGVFAAPKRNARRQGKPRQKNGKMAAAKEGIDANYFNLRFREQDVAVGNVASGSASVPPTG
jgi:hypothetical protein